MMLGPSIVNPLVCGIPQTSIIINNIPLFSRITAIEMKFSFQLAGRQKGRNVRNPRTMRNQGNLGNLRRIKE